MLRFFAAAALTGAVCASTGTPKKKPLKKYTIDLDLEPEQRFAELMKDHKNYYKTLAQALKLIFKSDAAHQFLNATETGLPDEYRRELQGIADATGVTLEHVLMGEFYYELSKMGEDELPAEWGNIATAACTGIVAQSTDGVVMHARNQDYPPPFSALQFDGLFTKNGKVLYEATNFAGIAGIGGTCMVPGGFSAEANARDDPNASFQKYLNDAAAGVAHFPRILRDACTKASDFESAVAYLSQTPMIATGYFTVAGAAPGEGAIVTRNASGTDTDVRRLEAGWPEGQDEKPWYLVQTNYDYWDNSVHPAPILPSIFGDDNRSASAIKLMADLGPDNVNLETLWGVMSDTGKSTGVKWGVYNQATIHTELIIPKHNMYQTYLRHNIVKDDLVFV